MVRKYFYWEEFLTKDTQCEKEFRNDRVLEPGALPFSAYFFHLRANRLKAIA